MALLPVLRQITDPAPNSGVWNMAVDQALLQSAIDEGPATLRWYRWMEPTVSLGYFQQEGEVLADPRLAGLPRVRRLSGGGALVHDRELTYSLTLPGSQRVIERPMDLYRLVHEAFVEVFRERGVNLALRGETLKLTDEPTLCFARQDEHDLVLNGYKVLGSAQRRRRGAILQHGGLLLKASAVTPELRGIADLSPAADLDGLPAALGEKILRKIAEEGLDGVLAPSETELAARLMVNPER